MNPAQALTPRAFLTLLLIATMFAANHVAARFAFNDGVDVATAVMVRSSVTAIVAAQMQARERKVLAGVSLLLAMQSLALYSAVARLPVALALLAFNMWPMFTAVWAALLYGQRPTRRIVLATPVLLFGLALALDAFGAASGLSAQAQWGRIGAGVAFAIGGAAAFALMMVVTQHEIARIDGRVRSAITMGVVGVLAFAVTQAQGDLPQSATGVWGVVMLTLLYGTAFVVMYTLLPRLGVVGSSPILNIEPVLAMIMAWALLGQHIAPIQIVGALIVVGTVMVLGLRKR